MKPRTAGSSTTPPTGGAHGIAIIDPERVNADLLAFIKGEMKS
jgi:hypothetical protein